MRRGEQRGGGLQERKTPAPQRRRPDALTEAPKRRAPTGVAGLSSMGHSPPAFAIHGRGPIASGTVSGASPPAAAPSVMAQTDAFMKAERPGAQCKAAHAPHAWAPLPPAQNPPGGANKMSTNVPSPPCSSCTQKLPPKAHTMARTGALRRAAGLKSGIAIQPQQQQQHQHQQQPATGLRSYLVRTCAGPPPLEASTNRPP